MIAYKAPAYVLFLQTVQEPDIESASRVSPLPKHNIVLLDGGDMLIDQCKGFGRVFQALKHELLQNQC